MFLLQLLQALLASLSGLLSPSFFGPLPILCLALRFFPACVIRLRYSAAAFGRVIPKLVRSAKIREFLINMLAQSARGCRIALAEFREVM